MAILVVAEGIPPRGRRFGLRSFSRQMCRYLSAHGIQTFGARCLKFLHSQTCRIPARRVQSNAPVHD